jgi:cell division protein FtsW (lipid II flippase)
MLVVAFADILASFGVSGTFPHDFGLFVVVMVGLGLAAHLVNRRLVPEADPIALPVVLVLNGLGYVMIARLAPFIGAPKEAAYQVVWTVVGVAIYIGTLLVIRRSRDLERFRYLLAFIAFGLLLLPLVPGIGLDIGGARLWVHIGTFFEFQPVEIAKLLLVIFFASYFVEKRELLSLPTKRVGNHLLPDLRSIGPIAVAWVLSILIILAEHDVGFSFLIFLLFMAMLWITTGRWNYVVIGLIAFVAGTFAAAHILPQIDQRFTVWLDPWKYPTTIGYQSIQGELAFAHGGLAGTGLGLSSAPQIPVATSDYIFAAIGEELGMLGAGAVVVAYLLLVGMGLRTALRARTEFARLTAAGLTIVFGLQSFVIMAGILRLLPLTGVTLPFVSYGGSSLIANYCLIALLMRISDEAASSAQFVPVGSEPTWSSTSEATMIGAGSR